ncbi:hypothetical protein HSX37_19060|uniref:Glycosyl hydrolases family 18 n=1 Tax=Dendrosporobacter quercicolus TaxID=146817 RepID=A0A1H0AWD1_9FIRM|nr:hypothetical protein [Dendrosporobacter quercicolus]NSL50107.1 hypothetical protein [Dendrosporobacter quercicolus DSM 1736]SDN37536.1 hypothetical protein SAMN04488502_1245 [Dendrosporobacter quercicolus]
MVLQLLKAAIAAVVFAALAGGVAGSHSLAGAAANETSQKAAWLAYWDLADGVKDLERIAGRLEQLSYFGAYFDQNDDIFIPQELSGQKAELQQNQGQYETYLTFVNDKQNADGSVIVKDIALLRRLFADEETMDRHIGEIIALTLQGGYDGIEIDYERVWQDEQVGQSYLVFAERLYKEALANNLKLRLVLEPGTPFDSAGFFRGPEYVVMFYNLYGLHSGPGPKANAEFIRKILTQMEALPGGKAAAFSTGGCLWGDDGEKRFLTEVQANTLAVTHARDPRRDKESQCLVFEYQDKGVSYQVWYTDVQTLNYWAAIAREQGVNRINLWRLGGNAAIDRIN